MVNSTHVTHLFWPNIGDDRFNVGNTKAKSIRDPRIKLAHRCMTMTITGRKETTNRVTEIDLFYLYYIFEEGAVCNTPYWLAKYLKGVRDKSVIFGGMFVTKIAQSFGLLTKEMVSVFNHEPPPHVYRINHWLRWESSWSSTRVSVVSRAGCEREIRKWKHSVINFDGLVCVFLLVVGVWLFAVECLSTVTKGFVEEDEGDDEKGDGEGGNEGAGGSADIYRNMSICRDDCFVTPLYWTIAAEANRGQEGNGSFGIQDLCLRQELLEYMGVHDNDASESSQPSWGKMCTSGT
ncbi:hypothetical protein Tco_0446490 [Tanacetum coccineum]